MGMYTSYDEAAQSPRIQRAVLEIDVTGFMAGTVIYVGQPHAPHAGFSCVFPDDSWRVIGNKDFRLCW